jgi:hypothetical protein
MERVEMAHGPSDHTLELLSFRTADIVNCAFRDTGIITALTDVVLVGADVLVVGGVVNFLNVNSFEILGFGQGMGLGVPICVWGGVAVLTYCRFISWSLSVAFYGAGQSLFVGGQSVGVPVSPPCAGRLSRPWRALYEPA